MTVHELKFLQIEGYIAELRIAIEKLLQFRHIRLLDPANKSKDGTTLRLGSGDFQHAHI